MEIITMCILQIQNTKTTMNDFHEDFYVHSTDFLINLYYNLVNSHMNSNCQDLNDGK
jgi:hypothetical protein